MNFVISGEVLDAARPFFFGASLVALSKPEGGVRPLGAEAAVHAARIYLHNMHPESLMLKVDFCNYAFNSIRRDKVLHSVLDLAPEIYPLVFSAYSKPSLLFFWEPHC